ncbi:MAG: methylenetetrahydrofolate dehydrogenase, partial [Bacillota bacterium]
MCAEVIDGKALAAEIYTELAQEVTSLKQAGRQPKLVVLLVGSHEASLSYVRAKKRIGATIGIEVLLEQFAEDVTEQVLLTRIKELNEAQSVDGILVQLPLPVHISVNKVICAILPTKDVDGFHPLNVGRWMTGQEAF